MDTITLGSLTNSISLKSQLMMKLLYEEKLKQAEDVSDEIRFMIFNYRRLLESLEVSETK